MRPAKETPERHCVTCGKKLERKRVVGQVQDVGGGFADLHGQSHIKKSSRCGSSENIGGGAEPGYKSRNCISDFSN